MSEKKEADISATWTVELNADCPRCNEHVDLLTAPDFWDGRMLEIAEHHTERTKSVDVRCPECYFDFKVCLEY